MELIFDMQGYSIPIATFSILYVISLTNLTCSILSHYNNIIAKSLIKSYCILFHNCSVTFKSLFKKCIYIQICNKFEEGFHTCMVCVFKIGLIMTCGNNEQSSGLKV